MKILNNLLGEHAKIHGDSIYLESGSNDDGDWVRLSDGTQICYGFIGDLRINKNYPMPFSSTMVGASIISSSASAADMRAVRAMAIGTSSTQIRIIDTSDLTVNPRFLAIGRWK